MNWVYLILAGLFEMTGVLLINKFNQSRNWQSLTLLIAGFGLSFVFLSLAMTTLPMGTAYAVWTGIGASGGAILGMILYNEPRNIMRILCIGLVLGSAVGLKLVS
ncbi:QacE family quaternary ammonium compound efflux SMR transporter [Paenibacillus macerans]|uniref:Multidrug resistance protein ykkD n=1 Tax=Paenibacillus macerans TaxID=44252 RepID=A0A090ZP66_PAEMA|nr:multidrug efflux SMR transporter [Paenibacillus macerans]KFN12223.1 multidrug resistance protein ykkD [Paenibacillus macerans]MBS5911823.1 multidrug efflux SMR transporter [Paenibacillus macerans]MCY7558406.1 multidrug efflux SMR transporter [Paenibacillus macerans]MDU5946990.1 multidrug efflux SMR transporter [Paenibacillus macerans]MDU7472216.1 multidrug efflux SMR transporter [Paenibacillus macerans]